jgi:hypothetical protein
MILLMRNHLNEFVPGCDCTAVRLDEATIDAIRRRAIAAAAVRLADGSAAEVRYWDASATCVGSPDPATEESVEGALGRGDGWAVIEDGALGAYGPAKADCTMMVIAAGDPPSVAWAYRVGSEAIRTVDVPLDALRRRLGPLGDPLKAVT